MKLFEWIGCLMAVLCMAEVIHNPKQALEDIRRGPAPNLAAFNRQLQRPRSQTCRKRANIGRIKPI